MLSTSFAFRRYVEGGGHLATKVEFTFADESTTTIYGEDLVMGGVSFSSATSSTSGFDIGAAIVGTTELTLANYAGQWDDADFTDATCVVSVGAALDGGTEWLRKGVYGVEQPESYDSTISLSMRDNMRLFERDYSDVTTVYPATLQTIVNDICSTCGVTMVASTFLRDSHLVGSRPDDSNTSCLDVLAWAMQAAGCWARMDPWGRLECRWYATDAFESEDWLDGGTFSTTTTPYSDGDVADGGGFHFEVDDADGGTFAHSPWATVTAIKSLTTSTDDVVVTGVRVIASDEVSSDGTQGRAGEEYLYGTEGYVLEVSGNPLVEYGAAQSVATAVGAAVVGMRFRPLTVSSLGDPAVEAGDPALVIDRRGRTYRTWVTSLTWKHGGFQSISCSAETPARNKADSYSTMTRAIVQQRRAVHAERTAREVAVGNLAQQLAESSGLFMTTQQQQDQSYIYYMHDKSTLAESMIVWKMTADALGISTNGGLTYPYGIDVTGTAILNRIYTIGLDATYITAGMISDQQGKYSWNLQTGVFTALDSLTTMVRTYGDGVLVCRPGNGVGALVNSSGSFDVSSVTWSNGVPTAGSVLTSILSTGMKVYAGGTLTFEIKSNAIYMKPSGGASGWTYVGPDGMYWYNGQIIKAELNVGQTNQYLDMRTVNLMAMDNGGRIWAYKGLSFIAGVSGMNPSSSTHSMVVDAHSPAIYMNEGSSTADGNIVIRPGNTSPNILKVSSDGVNVTQHMIVRRTTSTSSAIKMDCDNNLYINASHIYVKSTVTGNQTMLV